MTQQVDSTAQKPILQCLKDVWQWQSVKGLLLAASAITIIISLFDITLDAVRMLLQVASNFITCVSITFTIGSVMAVFHVSGGRRHWTHGLYLLALLAIGGMLGGLIGWGINTLIFPYRISHPHIYLIIVAILSIIFGLSFMAYENLSAKLDRTSSKLAEKEIQEQKLLRLKTEAELAALRAKVNPHFLFNTLNSIASLIPEDPERAENIVQRLSNLFHYVLSASESDVVPLDQELDLIRAYLAIEKVRLGDRLDYSVSKDDSLDGAVIPSMLLQPIVENGIKHGIAPAKDGGRIDIRCRREGSICAITIVDTGGGFDPVLLREGFGIGGVRQRLELNYPGSHTFDMTANGGVTVYIEIPITNDVQDRSRG